MAQTVSSAFAEFNKHLVNLDSERTKVARRSRDWLTGHLESFPEKIADFPRLYGDRHIKFGSFARNTKIRPLDDIDLILTFSADGATYITHSYGKNYSLNVPDTATNLRKLCNDNFTLNSIKVVNKLVSSLAEIEHYERASKHRRQEAATLQLSSYEWNFDIVPAFYTDTNYYLIPDGSGGWKATDPRVDQKKVIEINGQHDGRILQIIRTLKYWNRKAAMPTIPSYLFENIVLNYFGSLDKISNWIGINLFRFWEHLNFSISDSVPDPKGFQDELNCLSYDEKKKISEAALTAAKEGYEACRIELIDKDQIKAIKKWGEIFGLTFQSINS